MESTRKTIAEQVRDSRARVEAWPDLYDGDPDVAYWLVNENTDRSWTPSELGRALHIDTTAARTLLEELHRDGMIAADVRGAWTRYSSAARR
jgi:hypothetical protein